MKALYHEFTKGIPIIFVESFKDFNDAIGLDLNEVDESEVNGQNTFCRQIGFKGSPLKFIVFEEKMMRTLFGNPKHPAIVDATLALHVSTKRYPMNEKLAVTKAIKMTIMNERKDAFKILSTLYAKKFGTDCPYDMENSFEME